MQMTKTKVLKISLFLEINALGPMALQGQREDALEESH